MVYKIEVNKETCIGCGACAANCENFEMKDDGKAHPKNVEVDEMECNQDAADICPVDAITVKKI